MNSLTTCEASCGDRSCRKGIFQFAACLPFETIRARRERSPGVCCGAVFHSVAGKEIAVFLNVGGEGFADVSAVSGLDFPDDGRALALIDWDQDGDLDLWCVNRSGPQVRFLRNDLATSNHFLMLRLVGNGTSTNRDAIGARVEVVVKPEAEEEQRAGASSTLIKTVRAGDGFMSQSSKQLHFGLGACSEIEKLVVRWPGGQAEEIIDVGVDQHYRVVQGSGSAVLLKPDRRNVHLQASQLGPTKASDAAQVFFSSSVPLPKLQYELSSGETREVQPGSRATAIDQFVGNLVPALPG